jgi:type IV secretion system protein VirB10
MRLTRALLPAALKIVLRKVVARRGVLAQLFLAPSVKVLKQTLLSGRFMNRLIGSSLLVVALLLGNAYAQQQGSAVHDASATSGTITLPAGTKVPLALNSPISTKTARTGDPVYAHTTFPVVLNEHVAIPAGTYVQGVVSSIKRAGRVKGRAELLMHFTSLVYPNGYTVALPGSVDNVPGAEHQRTKGEEGTIQQDSEKGKDAATIAGTAATGAGIGAITAGGKGAGIGAGMGGAAGLAIAMLTRGSDVRLEAGTSIDMIFQRAITLDESRIHGAGK